MTDHLEESVRLYASYPFDTDGAFKKGLESILAGAALSGDNSSGSRDEIERRARVFYFNRVTGQSITSEQALAVEQTLLSERAENHADSLDPEKSASSSGESQTEEYVLTFAELQELITAGRVDGIPNNKVIPGGLNEGQPSISTATVRKKPWEVAVSESTTNQSMA